MKRLTISVNGKLAEQFDQWAAAKNYQNRSEAFRDLVRRELSEGQFVEEPNTPCVAVLSYVYNHHERQLANRLNELQHHHHELIVTSQHVHLDHDHCVESVILRGPWQAVKACADQLSSQTGVQQAQLHTMPIGGDRS